MENRYLASFGGRQGRRLRAAKQQRMKSLLPETQITLPDKVAHPSEFFTSPLARNDGQYFLEIGFGTGVHLAHQAHLHPAVGFIGCEPYIHGIGDLLKEIEEGSLHNIRIYNGDARLLMEKLPDGCLDKVFILYPDPWPKTRHQKRRLISKPFLLSLARVMKKGAELRLASDDGNYVAWMQKHLEASGDLFSQVSCGSNPPADWVTTRYEEKALKEGRMPTYLNFIKS